MGLLSWFNGPKVTAKDKAILDLKRQRDKIKQYQRRIGHVLEREHNLARQCLSEGNRNRALLFLRREQFQKQLLSKTDQQLASLEELAASIEFAQVQKDVVYGLQQGAKVLKEINAEMSLEKIEKMMDDSAEGIAYQAEVEALLSERISRSDEAEIERELAELERQTGKLSEDAPLKLPKAPSTAIESDFITTSGDKLTENAENVNDDLEEEQRLLAS